jgi:hypothetical protein
LVYFVAIWDILRSSFHLSPNLACCTEKNLATLIKKKQIKFTSTPSQVNIRGIQWCTLLKHWKKAFPQIGMRPSEPRK